MEKSNVVLGQLVIVPGLCACRLDDRGNMHLVTYTGQYETWRGHPYDIRRRQTHIRRYNMAVFMTAAVSRSINADGGSSRSLVCTGQLNGPH